jgi:hypothetical protein
MTGTAVAVANHRPLSVFSGENEFTAGQRIAKALITSDLVPEIYRGESKMGNALIALDMSNRMGIPPLMVMQNLDIIEGRPSWKSQFIIGALNSCGLFSPIRFRKVDHGEQEMSYKRWVGPKGNRSQETVKATIRNITCTAHAIEKATGEVLEGPEVSIAMAVAEGWYFRAGSKWPTMPDLMLMYRAAAFFGRLYAPHILNGMPTADEAIDVEYEVLPAERPEERQEPENKPAGRPAGVHAAMAAAKAADEPKARKSRPKAEKQQPAANPAETQDTGDETSDIEGADETGAEDEADDVFDAPGDTEYEPD